MARVYLSLGSNLGDRLAMLRAAVAHLQRTMGIDFMDASPLYEAEPWESEPGQWPGQERWYLNCAVVIDTALAPDELLDRLQAIEHALGREASGTTPEHRRYEPRTLDIDILLYEGRVISVPDRLQIPHLLLHERAFVLKPLAKLAPEVVHPTLYQTVRELALEVEDEHEVRPSGHPDRWFD